VLQQSELYEFIDNAQQIATVNVTRGLVQHTVALLYFGINHQITFVL